MALTTTQRTDLIKVYLAAFNRAPDASGLDFWARSINDGTHATVTAVADAWFADSTLSEVVAAYPAYLSNEEFVGRIYTNVFGRTADSEGLAFWANSITNGDNTKGSVLVNMFASLSNAGSEADKAVFDNKIAVSEYFAVTVGSNDTALAASVVASVDGTAASVTAANASIDSAASTGSTFTLTAGAATVNEGGSAVFTLDTENVAAGSEYTYVLSGVSAADVVGGSLSGTATIDSDGKAVIAVSLVEDATTEGAETLTVTVAEQTASVSVVDSSTTPVVETPTFELTASSDSVNEGGTAVFTLDTENVAAGTEYTYVLSGVATADVEGGAMSGTATIGADGKAVIAVNLVEDATTEGAESLTLAVADQTASVSVVDSSTTPVVETQTFELTASDPSVTEGDTGTKNMTFTLTLDEAPTEATTINYQTLTTGTATSGEDFDVKAGTVAFAAGQTVATVSITVNADTSFESDETVAVQFSGDALTASVTATGTITNDDVDPDQVASNFTLTTLANTGADFEGTSVSNIYNATLTTLTSGDSLDGKDGEDTLSVSANITDPTNVSGFTAANIETVSVSVSDGDAAADETATFNMLNVAAVDTISVTGATAAAGNEDTVAFTNVQNNAAINVSNSTNVNTNVTYAATVVAGTNDTASITLQNVTSTAAGDGQIVLNDGFETVSVTSNGSVANSVGTLDSGDAATLNIAGSNDLEITAEIDDDVATVDGSAATGELTLTSDRGAGDAISITTGSGADAVTMTGGATADDTVSLGAGNDTVTFTADLDDNDIVDGGDGTDTLVAIDADIDGLTTDNNISGFEALTFSDQLNGAVTVANVQAGLTEVNLEDGANTGTLTLEAGSQTVNINGQNDGALIVADTGAATDDSLIINVEDGADNINDQDLTVNGFETFTLDTGDTDQTGANITATGDVDGDGNAVAVTLTLTGAGAFTQNAADAIDLDGAAVGDLAGTIDASAMTGALVMANAANGVATITGGAGADTLRAAVGVDSTLTGNAGIDTLVGNSGDDSINGGAGNDTIVSSAGDDVMRGGDGNDTFEIAVGDLDANDTLDGGDGTDIIELDGLATADAVFTNVTSIETLTSDADGISVTLEDLAAAAGIATVTLAGTGAVADSVTIQEDFTGSLTVNLDALAGAGTDDNAVDASASTATISFVADTQEAIDEVQAAGDLNISGGSGTGDSFTFVGGTYTAAHLADVDGIETFTVSDDATTDITLANGNVADGEALTIDGRAITSAANSLTVNASNESNGAITVHGSTGGDTFTLTASDLGDTFNGYAGADGFTVAGAQLTTLDTIDGGVGTDTLTLSDDGAIVDADLTNISNMETFAVAAAGSDLTLGAQYQEAGFTTITGGAGDDVITLGAGVTGAQTINLVAGDDTIDASAMVGALTVNMDDAASLTAADTLTGGAGTSDVLSFTTRTGDADLAGVTGFDTISTGGDLATVTITLEDVNAASGATLTVDATANTSEAITITAANETNGAIVINSGAGGDTLTMSQSSIGDVINAGAGTDGISVAVAQLNSLDVVDGGAGTDTMTLTGGGVTADSDFTGVTNIEAVTFGTAGTAVLGAEYSESGSVTLTTAAGNDSIVIGAGVTTDQTIALVAGDDTVTAASYTGDLTVSIAEDNLEAADTITSGSGSDVLSITFDGDIAAEGGAADSLIAAEMANVTGFETIATASDAVGELILSDNNNVSSVLTIDATNNTAAAFTLDASAEDDGTIVYVGGAGIDTVTGTTGADTIGGGAGADVITGGNGSDTITGGAGADSFVYTAAAQSTGSTRDSITDFVSGTDSFAITLDQSAATRDLTFDATVQTAAAGTTLVQANLSGSIGQAIYDTTNSRLIVNANNDNLVTTLDYQIDVNAASTAADTIAAGDVDYTITAGSGDDVIVAGAGDDTITAGAGDDNITGGAGADVINGGAGTDTIAFAAIGDAVAVGGLVAADTDGDGATTEEITNANILDIITWVDGDDIIDLSAIDADTGVAGDQAFAALNVDNTAVAGVSDGILLTGTDHEIDLQTGAWDAANGDFTHTAAGADALLVLDDGTDVTAMIVIGGATLAAGDFVL